MRFTVEALNAVLKPRLYELALYYKLDVNTRSTKGEIIEKILKYFDEIKEADKKAEEESLPPMSIRVRRIYESTKES